MFQPKQAHGLNMNRIRELVDTADPFHLVPARLEGLQVPGQAGGLTGNVNDFFTPISINDLLQCLWMYTVSRWIEHDQIWYFAQFIDYFQYITGPK